MVCKQDIATGLMPLQGKRTDNHSHGNSGRINPLRKPQCNKEKSYYTSRTRP